MLRVFCFGELALELDGSPFAPPRSGRARSLLAWLALNPGLHPRSRLAGLLWPDGLEESARASLRTTLATLRRELGEAAPYVVTGRERIGLAPAPEAWVDAVAFDELVRTGRLEDAVELARGPLLADLDDDWALEARTLFERRLAGVAERLATGAEGLGDLEAAVRWSRRLVELDPLGEAGHRELIRRLAAAGDRAGALAAFAELRGRMLREFGTEPSPETLALADAVRRESAGAAAPPARAGVPLPAPLARAEPVPLLGRRAELDALRAAWRRAARGELSVACVTGEAGSGKSRLVAEIAVEAHQGGSTVLLGRFLEEPLGPYQAFAEALGRYVDAAGAGAAPALAAAELARIVPTLAERAAELPRPVEGDPDGARFRLFDAVAALVGAAAGTGALTLVLEDLHWADRSSLLLLGHLLRACATSRLFALCTLREGEGGPRELTTLLQELRRARRLEQVALGGLGAADVRELVSAWLGVEAPAGLASAVHRRTGGNPLYVEELVRHLLEAGAVALEDNAVLVGPAVEAAGVPETVLTVIEQRVAKLGGDAEEALTVGATVGDAFTLVELAAVTQLPPETLVEPLERSLAARLVEEEAAGRYRFAHALVREALLVRLTATRRALLHRRVGEALERLYAADLEPHLAELARHFAEAGALGDAARAVEYAERAAGQALARLSYEDAALQFERALSALEPAGSARRRRGPLLLQRGHALLRAGDAAGARACFLSAAAEARASGDAELLGRAVLGVAGFAVTLVRPRDDVVALLEEALAAGPPPPLRARLLARLAIELYYAPPVERRERLSADAVEAAAGSGDAGALLEALNARHVALWGPDGLDERIRIADELVERARAAGDRERELQGLNWRVLDHVEAGDLAAARAAIAAHEALADELRLPAYRWYGPMWRAMLAFLEGRIEEAERLSAQGEAIGRQAQDENAGLFADSQRLAAYALRGVLEDGLLALVGKRIAGSPAGVAWHVYVAELYADLDMEAESRAELEAIGDRWRDVPKDANWIYTMATLGRTAGLLDDEKLAGALYGTLLPYRGRIVAAARATAFDGSCSEALGLLATALGRFDEAEAHFEDALAVNRALGARPIVARTQVDYARMLERRGGRGDAGRAGELRAAALAEAEALGMQGLAARARKGAAQGRAPRPSAAPGSP